MFGGRAKIRELETRLAEAEGRADENARRAEEMRGRVKKREELIHELRDRFEGPSDKADVVERFNKLYYDLGDARKGTWFDTYWFGVPVWKCPSDLWLYQEMLFEKRPDFVVETGTAHGGSALFLAHVFDLLGSGRVVTVDIEEKPDRPEHPRITYITGSSTAPDVLERVRDTVGDAPAMVVLDSDHSKDHVLAELNAYRDFVPDNGYLVVEDTNVNGHPALPNFGPGPMEAVDEFLGDESGGLFRHDDSKEKLLLTFNPRGYLKKGRP